MKNNINSPENGVAPKRGYEREYIRVEDKKVYSETFEKSKKEMKIVEQMEQIRKIK